MGLINWIFDIYQHSKIDDVRREAQQARAELAAVRSGDGVDGERLVRALEELALATKALQRALVEKGVCTSSEIARWIDQIDREDGRSDGRTPL